MGQIKRLIYKRLTGSDPGSDPRSIGIDNGTDIWIALEYAPGEFGHYNLTGPFGLGFKSFSGQPDASTRLIGNYIRAGLVFTSQEYANGDLFLVDHVIDNGTHLTKLRRMTNYGEVMEAKISDFIWIY